MDALRRISFLVWIKRLVRSLLPWTPLFLGAAILLARPYGGGAGLGKDIFAFDQAQTERQPLSPGKAGSPSERMKDALEILVNVPAGRALVQSSLQKWGYAAPSELLKLLRWGTVSRTDAVLTRQLDPKTGTEKRERHVTIYIRTSQSLENLVLDIAHELVHATSQPAWDPYDPKLTPGKYIWAAIEGQGGEVDAVLGECQVALDLTTRLGASIQRCRSYLSANGAVIDKDKIRQDFYRVGKWESELHEKLSGEIFLFPLLSAESPRLYSSTGHAPYPVALLKEFQELTQVACENSRKRIEVFSSRKLAGLSQPAPAQETSNFIATRCR